MLRWLHQLLAFFFGRGVAVRKPVVEEIEPRILYSADANPLLWGGSIRTPAAIVAGVDGGGATTPQAVDAQHSSNAGARSSSSMRRCPMRRR